MMVASDASQVQDSSNISQLSSAKLQALHRHLTHAFLKPVCPDIRLRAFNRIYLVHRIFLVQSTFFNSLLDGEFREAKGQTGVWRHAREESRGDNVVELYFDDPNITRPAFEFCLASLYGAAPSLILPSWCCPSLEYPLTKHFQSSERANRNEQCIWPTASSREGSNLGMQHPATPRFLLSLIATAEYLGIPSVSSQALTLILCSITPYTLSHYLHFSLGYGIIGANEAQERQEGNHTDWDWELEGPIWGLEEISKECSTSFSTHMSKSDNLLQMEVKEEEDEEDSKAGFNNRFQNTSPSSKATKESKSDPRSPSVSSDRDHPFIGEGRLFYGAQSDKIGEACACWLLRWGADILLAEEQMIYESDEQDNPSYVSLFTIRKGTNIAPTNESTTNLPIPTPTVWCDPKAGGIPASWARTIISSDSFWIRSEWDRYDVARRMVSMRRGGREDFVEADESTSYEEDSSRGSLETRRDSNFTQQHQQGAAAHNQNHSPSVQSSRTSHCDSSEDDEHEYMLLFAEGIYYTHMTFEELSEISTQTCSRNGITFVPMNVLQSALWAQSELKNMILSRDRVKVESSSNMVEAEDEESDEVTSSKLKTTASNLDHPERELGLVSSEKDFADASLYIRQRRGRRSDVGIRPSSSSLILGGMRPVKVLGNTSKTKALEYLLEKRFFAVPTDDTIRIGENLSSLISADQSRTGNDMEETTGEAKGIASVLDHQTLHLTPDSKRSTVEDFFGLRNTIRIGSSLGQNQSTSSLDWTGYEPMRLGVDFYSVDKIKEKERMYSPSFFYAGSIWNLYLQIIKKPKGPQLGIYLHRQNCNDSLPNPSYPPPSAPPTEMLSEMNLGNESILTEPRTPARRDGNTSVSFYTLTSSPSTNTLDNINQADPDISMATASNQRQRSTLSTPLHSTAATLTPSPTSNHNNNNNTTKQASSNQQISTPYLDQRRILRAYFSVHCPSTMGTSMTRFSSRPDNFSLSQSWGWKSSSLLGAVYLNEGQIGSAESKISSVFRCIVTVGVV